MRKARTYQRHHLAGKQRPCHMGRRSPGVPARRERPPAGSWPTRPCPGRAARFQGAAGSRRQVGVCGNNVLTQAPARWLSAAPRQQSPIQPDRSACRPRSGKGGKVNSHTNGPSQPAPPAFATSFTSSRRQPWRTKLTRARDRTGGRDTPACPGGPPPRHTASQESRGQRA